MIIITDYKFLVNNLTQYVTLFVRCRAQWKNLKLLIIFIFIFHVLNYENISNPGRVNFMYDGLDNYWVCKISSENHIFKNAVPFVRLTVSSPATKPDTEKPGTKIRHKKNEHTGVRSFLIQFSRAEPATDLSQTFVLQHL